MEKVLIKVAKSRLYFYNTNRVIILSPTLLEVAKLELSPQEIDEEGGFFFGMMGHRWYISAMGNGNCNESEVEHIMVNLIHNNGK